MQNGRCGSLSPLVLWEISIYNWEKRLAWLTQVSLFTNIGGNVSTNYRVSLFGCRATQEIPRMLTFSVSRFKSCPSRGWAVTPVSTLLTVSPCPWSQHILLQKVEGLTPPRPQRPGCRVSVTCGHCCVHCCQLSFPSRGT